ncbi:MAG: AIPR family protein [Candidatus Omnitrophica bacterium]|nr:AIPR family protein [Candidatus Omnitrophota bacterium]
MSIFTLLDNRVNALSDSYRDFTDGLDNDVKRGSEFMLYSLEQVFKELQLVEIEEGITDSSYRKVGHDYGVDALYLTANRRILNSIEDLSECNEDSKFIFHLFQFKRSGLDLDSILKMKDGIQKSFIRNEIQDNLNSYLYQRTIDIASVREEIYTRYSPDQVKVIVYFIFSGVKDTVLDDPVLSPHIQEIEQILKTAGYANVDIKLIGAQELVDLQDKGDEIIESVEYVANLKYITPIEANRSLTGYICIIKSSQIANLVKVWQGALFEANIRDYYQRNELNTKIIDTCSSEDDSKYFWGLNNGMTIICRHVDEMPNNRLKLYGCQVVNGCQTANALYIALNNRERTERGENLDESKQLRLLKDGAHVLVKIIATKDRDLIFKITEATNSQTPIKTFSLRAGEDIQKNIERYLLDFGIYYERRTNFYRNQGKRNVVSIQKLFQLYLSYILDMPSQAKSHPKRLFKVKYDEVFPSEKERVVDYRLYRIPVEIDVRLNKNIRYLQRNKSIVDPYKNMLLSYGKFHIGCFYLHCIIGGNYDRALLISASERILKTLKEDKEFYSIFDKSFDDFVKFCRKNIGTNKADIPMGVRTAELDGKIKRHFAKKK